uniref:Uncharacterized protein n=1 Tax=viral metagenome TaxID=1070528 RepID=A0A6M3LIP2_9ZZZZ
MRRKKKEHIDKNILLEKKKKSLRLFKTEQRYECSLGSSVEYEYRTYMVCVVTPLFVFLIRKNGKIKKLTWEKFVLCKKSEKEVRWRKKIRDSIRVIKKRIIEENKLKKQIFRTPAIKRTPVPKIKKKRRKKWEKKRRKK